MKRKFSFFFMASTGRLEGKKVLSIKYYLFFENNGFYEQKFGYWKLGIGN